jgi:putative membrane protein
MHPRYSLTLAALMAALALAACDREERTETARINADEAARTATPESTRSSDQAGSMSGAGTATSAAGGQLASSDTEFVTKAAEGGRYEVEAAKLAAGKASDPDVKAFAQMLVDDRTASNEKLRQVASSHNLPMPVSLPADRKGQLAKLAKLSGTAFDKEFVKEIGVDDHKSDIADFEKAAEGAKADDVREFAQSTLPTLKKHLAAAEKLAEAGKGKA